ncbi:hypothetical protein [Borrelia miyamotoi]|uniref:hypothetical protein n=1 Tax=Borrelia miyamotoi TaxID=47466 RepID=UPI0018D477B1|nr:hypothetical protein [Borrelia miyamotoi]WAZ96974.1 hypothetical protein O5405_06770 [Borrelia miyamotoi]
MFLKLEFVLSRGFWLKFLKTITMKADLRVSLFKKDLRKVFVSYYVLEEKFDLFKKSIKYFLLFRQYDKCL